MEIWATRSFGLHETGTNQPFLHKPCHVVLLLCFLVFRPRALLSCLVCFVCLHWKGRRNDIPFPSPGRLARPSDWVRRKVECFASPYFKVVWLAHLIVSRDDLFRSRAVLLAHPIRAFRGRLICLDSLYVWSFGPPTRFAYRRPDSLHQVVWHTHLIDARDECAEQRGHPPWVPGPSGSRAGRILDSRGVSSGAWCANLGFY